MSLRIFLLILLTPALAFSQAKEISFNTKEFHSLANYFDSKSDLRHFFHLKNGQVIADIGSGEADEDGALSLVCDSLTIYSEDIDAKLLNDKKFRKMTEHYKKLKSNNAANFYMTLGTEKTTNLPDGIFDRILLISSFHEFIFKDEMIDDIRKKLKPDGLVCIAEAECIMKSHKNITALETINLMEKHGFSLILIDESDRNGSKGMYRATFKLKP